MHLPNEKLGSAFARIASTLLSGGILLVTVSDGTGKSDKASYASIDGEEYDRDFYLHSLEELRRHSLGLFEFIAEILPDPASRWRNYIFKKA